MASPHNQPHSLSRIAIDIGSTVIKVAKLDADDQIISQDFHPRDFKAGIAKQVTSILDSTNYPGDDSILICSSANGGLSVGIVCLSKHFSGSVLRNQVLLAGANPMFVHDYSDSGDALNRVDILIVAGGIDNPDAAPLDARLQSFDAGKYNFSSLVYAGNTHLASSFLKRFPKAIVVANPLAASLQGSNTSVFEAVRRAYLDDLVYKEGVSELKSSLARNIRPTPEVVSRGFQRAVFVGSGIEVLGSCILLDIGGATTDIHYTVEIVRDNSDEKPLAGSSIARYVFTDLGTVASRQSTLLQLRTHPRLYEFLARTQSGDVTAVYRSFREGEYEPPPELLAYACLFLALDRFAHGRAQGLPAAELGKVSQLILTGGAAQGMDLQIIERLVELFLSERGAKPRVLIDTRYQMWVQGITWSGGAVV